MIPPGFEAASEQHGQDGGRRCDGQNGNECPRQTEHARAGGGAEREDVGTGRNAGKRVRQGEIVSRHPLAAHEFALEQRHGGIAAAERGVAYLQIKAPEGGEGGLVHFLIL
jgi:hypothetical protein